jgi:hypothetical protein
MYSFHTTTRAPTLTDGESSSQRFGRAKPTSLPADVMAKSAAKSTHQGENEPILEGQAIKMRY